MAQLYQTTIAPLADVANQNTADMLRHRKAPGTVQGQNLDPNHVLAADLEAERLRFNHVDNPVNVTTEELALGLVRSHAIRSEFVAQIYPAAGAPVWFNNALTAALTAALAPIRADVANIDANQVALQNSVGALQNSVGALQNSVDTISVRFENQNIKRQNNARLIYNDSLTPLKKQVAGRGLGLTNRNLRFRYPDFAVGDSVDVDIFPRTDTAIHSLTRDQLSDLSKLYNEDFGIIQGDTIETQRIKFKDFIS